MASSTTKEDALYLGEKEREDLASESEKKRRHSRASDTSRGFAESVMVAMAPDRTSEESAAKHAAVRAGPASSSSSNPVKTHNTSSTISALGLRRSSGYRLMKRAMEKRATKLTTRGGD